MTFELEVGQLIAERYQLVRLLGQGAMGEVWLATHTTLREQFAVKFLRPEAGGGEELERTLGRFLFEAQVAARLSRKTRHIVRVTDQGEDRGVPYLVMERLEGESLEARMASGPLPVPLLRAVLQQCARGLTVAHAEGVFHRDLKPGNVFLTVDEDGQHLVKLLDFGIARAARPDGKRAATSTGRGVVLGTPSYMSPEQARGHTQLDHRCDVWALAVVAYEGLTGEIPFLGDTVEDIFVAVCTRELVPIARRRSDLGADVSAFFERAFAEKPGDRFQSADELARAFGALGPIPERPPTSQAASREVATHAKLAVSMSPETRPSRASASRVGAAAGLFVLALGALGATVALSRGAAGDGAAAPPPEPAPSHADVARVGEPVTSSTVPVVALSALPPAVVPTATGRIATAPTTLPSRPRATPSAGATPTASAPTPTVAPTPTPAQTAPTPTPPTPTPTSTGAKQGNASEVF